MFKKCKIIKNNKKNYKYTLTDHVYIKKNYNQQLVLLFILDKIANIMFLKIYNLIIIIYKINKQIIELNYYV